MDKLAAIRALELTAQLWNWLAEDIGRDKNKWPMWEDKEVKAFRGAHSCLMCALFKHDNKDLKLKACKKCQRFWEGGKLKGQVLNCDAMRSPYYSWRYANGKVRARSARRIAFLAQKRLAELKNELKEVKP